VKARPADRILAGTVTAGLHTSRDSFYRTAGDGRQQRAGVIPLRLLPRRCPLCRNHSIVGHGRRFRFAHDDQHQRIWVRRGICRPCRKTFTLLPDWLVPMAPFSLRCRRLACERLAAGDSVDQAAPHCQDPSRSPDPSTLRRWAYRRLHSVCCWMKAGGLGPHFSGGPTILAWDLLAVCHILPIEARSP
jgi:hypothetical protein